MREQRKTPARRAGRRPPNGLKPMVDRVMNERAMRRAALLRLRERERAQERRP